MNNLELELQSYLDGELSARDRRRVEERLASDSQAQQLFAELQTTKSVLTQNEPELKLPESHDFYWSKIERQIQRESRETQKEPARILPIFAWRKFLAPMVGAAAMLAFLMVSVKQFSPVVAYDDITDTSEEMEALTFHDESAGMTVVWLQDRDREVSATGTASDVDTQ